MTQREKDQAFLAELARELTRQPRSRAIYSIVSFGSVFIALLLFLFYIAGVL